MEHVKLSCTTCRGEGRAAGLALIPRSRNFQARWGAAQPSSLRAGKLAVRDWTSSAGKIIDMKKGQMGSCPAPLVVVGPANAHIYVEVDCLPAPGETITAGSGCTLRGAYQATCAARFAYSSFLSGQVASQTNILYKTVDVGGFYKQSTMEQPRSHARIVASLDSDAGKADGARKALEQAFQGKSNLAKKWEEEIKKRELSGGDGVSGGGSGGGGGGWKRGGGGDGDEEEMGESFGPDEPWDWEEFGQTFMATFALLILYISITHGPKQLLKKVKLLVRFIRQGFRLRKIPEEYLTAEGSGIPSDNEEVDEDEEDDYEDGDEAAADFIRQRRADMREANVQEDNAVDDEAEDEEDDIPAPPTQQSRREDLLSKRQAEQKEKLLQLLTPKELRQQQEEKK